MNKVFHGETTIVSTNPKLHTLLPHEKAKQRESKTGFGGPIRNRGTHRYRKDGYKTNHQDKYVHSAKIYYQGNQVEYKMTFEVLDCYQTNQFFTGQPHVLKTVLAEIKDIRKWDRNGAYFMANELLQLIGSKVEIDRAGHAGKGSRDPSTQNQVSMELQNDVGQGGYHHPAKRQNRWYLKIPFTELVKIAESRVGLNTHNHNGVPSLRYLSQAALTADQKVAMATNDRNSYWEVIDKDAKHRAAMAEIATANPTLHTLLRLYEKADKRESNTGFGGPIRNRGTHRYRKDGYKTKQQEKYIHTAKIYFPHRGNLVRYKVVFEVLGSYQTNQFFTGQPHVFKTVLAEIKNIHQYDRNGNYLLGHELMQLIGNKVEIDRAGLAGIGEEPDGIGLEPEADDPRPTDHVVEIVQLSGLREGGHQHPFHRPNRWRLKMPFSELVHIAESRGVTAPFHDVVPSLRNLSQAAIPAEQRVNMAEHDSDLYWELIKD